VGRLRRYALLTIVVALNAAAWSASLALGPGGFPPRHVAAEFFSTSAVLLMSTNAMLSTRPVFLERIYGGLDKLFISHRAIGVAVALAVASHFALMPETPGSPTKPLAYTNISLILLSIGLAIAPRSPWRKLVPLRYQYWKLEHRFMGLFLAFAVVHSLSAHPIMLTLPIERTWVYSIAALGLLAYLYREFAERLVKERHNYVVAETRHAGADVLEIHLSPVARPIPHRSGQFAFARFRGGPTREQHPFTLSAAPSGDGSLRFSVKASGDYTAALQSHLEAGSAARIEGPYGGFDHRLGGPRQLWLAGGIGITPFLAFLGDLDSEPDVRLVWSVRDPAEATYAEEIEHAVLGLGNVRFDVHASKTSGHLALADLDLGDASELSVFVCGPVRMRDAFLEQLDALGVPRAHVFYEEFSLR